MRSPNLNIQSRMPTINPTVTPRINPNHRSTAGHRPLAERRSIGVTSTLPNARFSPNLSPACSYAHRDSSGECQDKPVSSSAGGGAGKSAGNGKKGGAGRNASLAAFNPAAIPNEFVAEIDGSLSDAQADALARRHGLVRLQSQNFPLVGATIGLFRITDGRPVEKVRRAFAAASGVRSVQLNFRYWLTQNQKTALTEGDPAQYALAKLRLPQAHTLASGANVTIAVIDSGIDDKHPELMNSVADNFDALGSKEGPHVHGTGIAGAIVSHGTADGERAAGQDFGDPRLRHGGKRRGEHHLRDPEGVELCRPARRPDRQYELRRSERSADRARYRRHGRERDRDGRGLRQRRCEIAAALSRR